MQHWRKGALYGYCLQNWQPTWVTIRFLGPLPPIQLLADAPEEGEDGPRTCYSGGDLDCQAPGFILAQPQPSEEQTSKLKLSLSHHYAFHINKVF